MTDNQLLAMLVLFCGLLSVAVPFFGESSLKFYKGSQWANIRALCIVISFIGLVLFAPYQIIRNDNEQTTRDVIQTRIKEVGDTTLDKVNRSLSSLEGLSLKIDDINNRTSEVLDRREQAIENFSRLNEKLEMEYSLEEKKIADKAPIVQTYIDWVQKPQKNFEIKFSIENTGQRIADSVDMGGLVLRIENGRVSHYKESVFMACFDLPSGQRKDTEISIKPPVEDLAKEDLIICLFYTYKDAVTKKRYKQLRYMVWPTHMNVYDKENPYRFGESFETKRGVAEKYLKENGIKLVLGSGKQFQ